MKFRKRPVIIDAVQWEGPETTAILTLEGVMQVNIGDWIITGVEGEKYPCHPRIFEKTYEPVEIN